MKNDRPKYMPDVEKVLKDCDPATFDVRQRKALAKVRAAGLIERLTPAPAPKGSATSPGAKDGASVELDAAALPSAMGPAEERPVTKPARPPVERKWPEGWVVVGGCLAFMLTVALIAAVVMNGRAKESADKV